MNRVGVMLACCLFGVGSVARGEAVGQTPLPLESGEKAHIKLVLRISPNRGSTVTAASTDAILGRGEAGESALGVGEIDDSGRLEPAIFGSMDGTGSGARSREYAHRWIAKYEVGTLTSAGVQVELHLVHEFGPQSAPADVVAKVDETIVVAWGEPAVLDYLDLSDQPGGTTLRNAVVELLAEPEEAPEFARAVLSYELWLTGDGQEGAQSKIAVAGHQGEEIPFVFAPRSLPVATVGERQIAARVGLEGSVVGRLRSDGALVLSVRCRRSSSLALEASERSGSRGSEEGVKTVIARPDEVVRIDLPPAGGMDEIIGPSVVGARAAGQGVRIDGDTLTLDWGSLLEGHEGSVVIRARRID